MSSPASSADPTRLLVFVLNLNNTGHAVLDRWGLAPGSFGVFDLHHTRAGRARVERLITRIRRALRRFRPSLVVLGVASQAGPTQREVLAEVRRRLRAARVRVVTRSVDHARRVLCTTPGSSRRGELGDLISQGFFPELACRVVTGIERHVERAFYWRRAFHALALGLHEFAERHPRQAFALVRQNVGDYAAIIADAERRQHPDL